MTWLRENWRLLIGVAVFAEAMLFDVGAVLAGPHASWHDRFVMWGGVHIGIVAVVTMAGAMFGVLLGAVAWNDHAKARKKP